VIHKLVISWIGDWLDWIKNVLAGTNVCALVKIRPAARKLNFICPLENRRKGKPLVLPGVFKKQFSNTNFLHHVKKALLRPGRPQ
jgi:hypothetical protein